MQLPCATDRAGEVYVTDPGPIECLGLHHLLLRRAKRIMAFEATETGIHHVRQVRELRNAVVLQLVLGRVKLMDCRMFETDQWIACLGFRVYRIPLVFNRSSNQSFAGAPRVPLAGHREQV